MVINKENKERKKKLNYDKQEFNKLKIYFLFNLNRKTEKKLVVIEKNKQKKLLVFKNMERFSF